MADPGRPRESGAYREEEALHLRAASSLAGYTVAAHDGVIGAVQELLFDDDIWAVRYIEVDPGDWLPGRKVLISPLVLQEPDWELPRLSTTLTREQVAGAPRIGKDEPVSRLHQVDLFMYYGWLPYWMEEEYYNVPSPPPGAAEATARQRFEQETAADRHLFASGEMTEFRIQALDGDAGHVEDFIMDEEDWVIHYLVVALDSPLPEQESGRSVLVSTEWVQKTVREEERIYVDLDRERVLNSPEYDPAVPVTREFELAVYDHYGRPRYWEPGGDVEEDDDMRFLS